MRYEKTTTILTLYSLISFLHPARGRSAVWMEFQFSKDCIHTIFNDLNEKQADTEIIKRFRERIISFDTFFMS